MTTSLRRRAPVLALACFMPLAASASTACDRLLRQFGSALADATCVDSADLTTTNPDTTPANNSIAGLPAFAFTPQTDRATISPSAAKRAPITKVVPGIQLNGRIASDPTGQARFLLRLPKDWNGRLVVAGASGTRSEFNGDFSWSDYVVQKGYAYASQNKGVLNLQLSTAADPLGCRLNPVSPTYVNFYDNGANQPFSRWAEYMVKAAELARQGVAPTTADAALHLRGRHVQRRLPGAPRDRDGARAVRRRRRLGRHLRRRARAQPAHRPAAGRAQLRRLRGRGPRRRTARPPRTSARPATRPTSSPAPRRRCGRTTGPQFWEVTQCQWQKRLDPTYDTYGSGTGTYNYVARLSASDVGAQGGLVRHHRPHPAPAGHRGRHDGRAAAHRPPRPRLCPQGGGGAVATAGPGPRHDERDAPYRLYEVQNGNHIETFQDTFPQLALIEPHAHAAFDLLVAHVETHAPLPASQCVPKGGASRQPGAAGALRGVVRALKRLSPTTSACSPSTHTRQSSR